MLRDLSETGSAKLPKGQKLRPRKVLREFKEGLFTQRWQKKPELGPAQKLIGLLEGAGIGGCKHWVRTPGPTWLGCLPSRRQSLGSVVTKRASIHSTCWQISAVIG